MQKPLSSLAAEIARNEIHARGLHEDIHVIRANAPSRISLEHRMSNAYLTKERKANVEGLNELAKHLKPIFERLANEREQNLVYEQSNHFHRFTFVKRKE